MIDWHPILVSGLLMLAMAFGTWLLSLALRDVSIVDSLWSLFFLGAGDHLHAAFRGNRSARDPGSGPGRRMGSPSVGLSHLAKLGRARRPALSDLPPQS